MFNNITNFLNLISNRKIKTAATIEDTDLIPLGTRDPNFLGGYQPTAITYQELVDSLPVDGVASISDNGTGVVTVDNTDPENPVKSKLSILFVDHLPTISLIDSSILYKNLKPVLKSFLFEIE